MPPPPKGSTVSSFVIPLIANKTNRVLGRMTPVVPPAAVMVVAVIMVVIAEGSSSDVGGRGDGRGSSSYQGDSGDGR